MTSSRQAIDTTPITAIPVPPSTHRPTELANPAAVDEQESSIGILKKKRRINISLCS